MLLYTKNTALLNSFVFIACCIIAFLPQDASAQAPEGGSSGAAQLGFSELQSKANQLTEEGQLTAAIPLLKELIKRVKESPQASETTMDFPMFIIGTGYIQSYASNGKKEELIEALTWYDRLQAEYPESQKNKDADLKRIDLLRVLGQFDKATDLMIRMLSNQYKFNLQINQRIKILKDLCQTYYATNKLKEGLPYFELLLNEAQNVEDKTLAAAASFEAQVEAGRLDDALTLIPDLTIESKVRYSPRLNVALLRTSDLLAEQGRYIETAIMLSLIKTTDVIIRYYETQLEQKKAELKHFQSYGQSQDRTDKINQEINTFTATITQLKKLPSLRNELLVRRARNYTLTERRYEAFWMFYDLATENPTHKRIEFYTFASFSNALQIGKREMLLKIGKQYREKFPEGEYFSDVSSALVFESKEMGDYAAFLDIIVNFLNNRPMDPVSNNFLVQWGSYQFENENLEEVISKCGEWQAMHNRPIFEDGLFYWSGLAHQQKGSYEQAITQFEALLAEYPTSLYAEDAHIRKGSSQFYAQLYNVAEITLLGYTKKYTAGVALDQAFYFLGEIQSIKGDFEGALTYFSQAEAVSQSQSIFDSIAFSRGSIYEQLQQYDAMTANFEAYLEKFGKDGRRIDAIVELGKAYQFNLKPNSMLSLYNQTIREQIMNPDEPGVDTLVEAYAKAYYENKSQLISTVEFLDRLNDDLEFREKIVTDRGFLFEFFYTNSSVEPSLYETLRNHPNFNASLLKDLSPIANVTGTYREELLAYPSETPEQFFRALLEKHQNNQSQIATARALMGLYRLDIKVDPVKSFSLDLIGQATPRLILYIADYERMKRREFAVQAWEHVLENYPLDDAAIVAYMRLADISAENNRNVDALEYLEAIEKKFPGSPLIPGVILRQGELLSEMSQGDAAREKYQYILRVPDWRGEIHARALLQTGDSYAAESNFAAAHGFYERTFLGYSHFAQLSAEAYLADAEALLAMGKPLDAKATLQEAVELLEQSAPQELMQSIKLKLKELAV